MTKLIPSAGPAVQNMFRKWRPTVRPPPTSFGTRMVVSESGVIFGIHRRGAAHVVHGAAPTAGWPSEGSSAVPVPEPRRLCRRRRASETGTIASPTTMQTSH